jgi:threonine dehydrogenase-like Zn-dependent dehydrogenase
MKAVCWHGKEDVRVDEVPDPRILNPRDAIVKVSLAAICGSDLHLYDGYVPTMQEGDILGHEFMGEVVETGSGIKNLRPGDRVVVPFPISCGNCWYCQQGLWALCDNSNPNSWMVEKMYGDTGAGIYGYSHLYGGYSGGQAQYVRIPYADVGPVKIPEGVPDEKVLFLGDIFPTGYMAAENCGIHPGDTVAVWGCGPVGLLAMKSAWMLGAHRVIGIDRFPERLRLAREGAGADVLNPDETDVPAALHEMTGGRGPDACIEAVGMEAEGTGIENAYDKVKQALRLETDRGAALRQAIHSCRKGGTVSIPGVYAGFMDKFPIGAVFGKGLTIRTGQTHVQKYLRPLLEKIEAGEIDPSFIITHRIGIDEAPEAYRKFRDKEGRYVKVVMRPH